MKDSNSAPVKRQAAYQSIPEDSEPMGYQSVSENFGSLEGHNVSKEAEPLECRSVSGSSGSLKPVQL